MRMDRYEDLLYENNLKQTRTNKNQELYTDVYLNNVYVDINDLKEAMYIKNQEKDELKKNKEEVINNYAYEDRVYDINILVEDTIKNKKNDNLKRSLDKRVDDLELVSLIDSINENQKRKEELEKEKINENDNLLTDLLPENSDTITMEPLAEPILEKNDLDTLALKARENLDEDNDFLVYEKDESFVIANERKFKKILIIVSIILVILLIIFLILWKLGFLSKISSFFS